MARKKVPSVQATGQAGDPGKKTAAKKPDESPSDAKPAKPATSVKRRGNGTRRTLDSLPIVGMGASAGGLESFEKFFRNMPPDSGIAFVLVPHLDPAHASLMAELLQRHTSMEVVEAENNTAVRSNHVYVVPPNKDIALHEGRLRLTAPVEPRGIRMAIDFFLRSLAEDQGERSIGIILSGSGTDGTMGIRAIHGEGGMSMVEDPETAQYDGMPRSAISTGVVDYILPAERMPAQLITYVRQAYLKKARKVVTATEKAPKAVARMLTLLRHQTGHDFSQYKKNTIFRRIERRMSILEVDDPDIYVRFLQEHPEEVQVLFKELLISVTSFFRDREAFEALQEKMLPKILEGKPEDYTIRVWVPGCATGEEAYSIAIVIREYIDRHNLTCKFQIFGTDIDEDAITTARAATYPGNIAIDVTPERLRRYFVKTELGGFRIKKDIREPVVFAVQNVTKDAPFSKLDLVSCRNLLIYLETDLQNKLLPLFHYSLRPGGLLFLGSSETIGKFADLFSILDKKWKYFQRKETVSSAQTMMFTGLPAAYETRGREELPVVKMARQIGLRDLAEKVILESFAPPCVIINEKADILYVHGRTGKYLEPATGQASFNLLNMAREGIAFALTTAMHNALTQRKPIITEGLQVKTNGGFQPVDLMVKPINEPDEMKGLLMVVFKEVPQPGPAPEGEGGRVVKAPDHERIDGLERELRFTRENLQTTIEELQASNEELKSTNEELQSTNEELQSTNEEMETSKEELQSVNEELMTVNSELRAKIDQLSRSENDMRNLLDSTTIGTIFLDSHLNIKRFTSEATKIINLIPSDVGRPVSHIVSNLNYDGLASDAQAVLDTLVFREMEVETKEGNWYIMRIMPYRTAENVIDGVVITFNDITKVKQGLMELADLNREARAAARDYKDSIVETVREPLLILDKNLMVLSANRYFRETFRLEGSFPEGATIYDIGNGEWDMPELRHPMDAILSNQTQYATFELTHTFPRIGKKRLSISVHRITNSEGETSLIVFAAEDMAQREQSKGGV